MNSEIPWTERFRPTTFEEIVGNKDAVERLSAISKQGNLPNLILSGPPGTGKTTCVFCLARAMLGENYREAVLEMNASDDRGIDVIRSKVKLFAQKKVQLPPGTHKIVILDEADSMTSAAQQALRRTMELTSGSTRFVLACNISTKVIEPLQSRCAILRFAKLTDQEILNRLLLLCQELRLSTTPEGLQALLFAADGDLRSAVNGLQATASGFDVVSAENVLRVCDFPSPKELQKVLEDCRSKHLRTACERLRDLFAKGYCAVDVVTTLFKVVKSADMEDELRIQFIKEIGLVHMRVLNGSDSLLQLYGLCSQLTALK